MNKKKVGLIGAGTILFVALLSGGDDVPTQPPVKQSVTEEPPTTEESVDTEVVASAGSEAVENEEDGDSEFLPNEELVEEILEEVMEVVEDTELTEIKSLPVVTPVVEEYIIEEEPIPVPESSGEVWYTSGHHSAKYYYHESCDGWQGLSERYLMTYTSEAAVVSAHSVHVRHPECNP